MKINIERANSYGTGHPWYYVLGGPVLKPRKIIERIKERKYQGYMADDIITADRKPEPQRSEALRAIKDKAIRSYRRDLSCYRELACELRKYRQRHALTIDIHVCENIHTNISLKHNHLYNDFAHLILLDELLSRQPDLFDF